MFKLARITWFMAVFKISSSMSPVHPDTNTTEIAPTFKPQTVSVELSSCGDCDKEGTQTCFVKIINPLQTSQICNCKDDYEGEFCNAKKPQIQVANNIKNEENTKNWTIVDRTWPLIYTDVFYDT